MAASTTTTTKLFLDIIEQPETVLYNAVGGKKKGLTVRVGLFSKDVATGTVTRCRRRGAGMAIPLQARVLYTSGLPATSLKTDDDLLVVIEEQAIGADGEGRIKFRMEEVSGMHRPRGGDGGRFILEISAPATEAGEPLDLGTHYTDAFTIRSKVPSAKKQKRKSLTAAAQAAAAAAACGVAGPSGPSSGPAAGTRAPRRKRASVTGRRSRSRSSSSSASASASSVTTDDGNDSDTSTDSAASDSTVVSLSLIHI